ncbi:AMP-binding enzyme family protein 16 [Achromobacter xylosoxidans A8]|uniref:AMP-binding enzyme family protein 16 n=1 Tax=Achromobacter xylosoxidans (strain A8) TaxID=762376 RepID=E3HR84_ACHXA|nr:AMP-binding protein [Achromobacter xylosoxidans]ADP17218.1 AMP-binding enzyme family protein 16 [Achromobacter xylosoxidans A8]
MHGKGPESKGFYSLASRHPERIAYIEADGTTTTFGKLLDEVNRLSNGLRARGLRRGDAVAVLLKNCQAYFELALATGQLGLYMVPINWHLTAEEIVYILRDSDSKMLIASNEFAPGLASAELPAMRFSIEGGERGWGGFDELKADSRVPDQRSAGSWMGYTSGTTGRPKGVKRKLADKSPEDVIGNLPDALDLFGVSHDPGCHLVFSPLYHSAPAAWAMMSLHRGHTIVCRNKFDAELALRDIEKYRVSTVHMVPTHFVRLLRLENRKKYDVSSLKCVVHAGAPCPIDVKFKMMKWLGPKIWEYLGSTEAGMYSMVGPEDWLSKPGTVGRAAPGTVLRIVDENGQELPAGEVGMIYARSAMTDYSYHNDEEKTRSSRLDDGYATAGDIGTIDEDGFLFILDRRNDLILSGGVNIYPAEIEGRLITHGSVKDVAVIGVSDPEWGQSVLAVIQPADAGSDRAALVQELRAYAAETLAGYKCPGRYEFLDELPRTEAGKLQRNVLRDRYNTSKMEI